MSVDDHFRGNELRRVSSSVASLTLYIDLMNREAFGIRGRGKFNVVGIHKSLEKFL